MCGAEGGAQSDPDAVSDAFPSLLRPILAVAQVLEGYVYLGNVASLGEEVMAAFAAVMGDAALKVVRGVVLMRPTAGLEERAKSTQLLQELVKWLPPDLFRTCLSRVR